YAKQANCGSSDGGLQTSCGGDDQPPKVKTVPMSAIDNCSPGYVSRMYGTASRYCCWRSKLMASHACRSASVTKSGYSSSVVMSVCSAHGLTRERESTSAQATGTSHGSPSSPYSVSASSLAIFCRRLSGGSSPYFSLRKRVWQYRCASAATLRSTCEFIPAPMAMPMNGRTLATLLTGTFVPAGPSWFISDSSAAMILWSALRLADHR